jgi:hypothetical protein
VLGSEAFRQELLAAVVERVGPNHYGAQRQDTAVQKAERIVKEEIERLGWDEDQLRARRKGHRSKVMLARRLRQETTMSLKWIITRFGSYLVLQAKQRAHCAGVAHRVAPEIIIEVDENIQLLRLPFP